MNALPPESDRATRDDDERGMIVIEPYAMDVLEACIKRLKGSGFITDIDARRLLARLELVVKTEDWRAGQR